MSVRTSTCLAILLAVGVASAASPSDRVVHNSIGMTFVQVPSGQFMMGSRSLEPRAAPDEQPRHAVRIAKSFYLGMFEVTQQEYKKVMGEDPSRFSLLRSPYNARHTDLIVTQANALNPLNASLPDKVAALIEKLNGVSAVCAGIVDFRPSRNAATSPWESRAGRQGTACSAS